MISKFLIINLLAGSAIATETVAPFVLSQPSPSAPIIESHTSSIVQRVSSTSYIKFLVDNIFSDVRNQQFKPIDQRIFLDFTYNNILQLNIFYRICETSPEMVFGKLQQKGLDVKEEWSDEKRKRIKDGYQLFNNLFSSASSQNITFGELKNLIDEKIFSPPSSLSNKEILSIGNAFRHLVHPYFNNLTTDLGDYAAEYILTMLIKKIETHGSGPLEGYTEDTYKLLSEIYYQLSQTYTHLLSYTNKIFWENNDVGYIQYKDLQGGKILNFPISYKQIKDKRLHLLQQAISYNPDNLQAWIRVLEFYFLEEDKGSFQDIVLHEIGNLPIDYLYLLIKIFKDAINSQDIHFVNKEGLKTSLLREFESKKEAINKKVAELKLQQQKTELEKKKEVLKKKLAELELKKKREAVLNSLREKDPQNNSTVLLKRSSEVSESNPQKKQRMTFPRKEHETFVQEAERFQNTDEAKKVIEILEERAQPLPHPTNNGVVREERGAPLQ